jgi:hypothetical protein
LFRRSHQRFLRPGFAQPDEGLVPQVGQRKNPVKRGLQLRRQRAIQTHPDVAPAARHAVALVFVRHVESADEGDAPIAGEQFSVIADAQAADGDGVEDFHLRSRRLQRMPEVIRQF